jgi:hypothetical protein
VFTRPSDLKVRTTVLSEEVLKNLHPQALHVWSQTLKLMTDRPQLPDIEYWARSGLAAPQIPEADRNAVLLDLGYSLE